jgi:hypothetical protein
MITASVDTKGLQFMLNGLQNSLIGMGGDASTVVKDECRMLAVEISKRAAPRDRKKTAENIDKSVRSKFLALSADQGDGFEGTNGGLGESSSGNVKWYAADRNFLFGVARDSDMRHADPQTLANIYYASKKKGGKTRLILPFQHPRQHQRVAITTKITASKSGINAAIQIVKKGIGKLPASWFATAKKIQPSLMGPQWIERHIKGDKTTKSITDLSSMNSENSSITFGSKAIGVTKFARKIQGAIDLRAKKVSKRMNLIMSGYSRDVAAGIRPRHHAKETHES